MKLYGFGIICQSRPWLPVILKKQYSRVTDFWLTLGITDFKPTKNIPKVLVDLINCLQESKGQIKYNHSELIFSSKLIPKFMMSSKTKFFSLCTNINLFLESTSTMVSVLGLWLFSNRFNLIFADSNPNEGKQRVVAVKK